MARARTSGSGAWKITTTQSRILSPEIKSAKQYAVFILLFSLLALGMNHVSLRGSCTGALQLAWCDPLAGDRGQCICPL